MNRARIAISAGSALALAAGISAAFARPGELVGAQGLAEVARQNQAAKAQRSKGKALARRAVSELVRASQNTIVLEHLHPRWLRNAVTARLDAGEAITQADVDQMRAAGPGITSDTACTVDGRPCIAKANGLVRCHTPLCGRTIP
jgi:hypothetical protein